MNTTFKDYKKFKKKLNDTNVPYFENYNMGNILSMKIYHMKKKHLHSIFFKIKESIMKLIMIFFFDSYNIDFNEKSFFQKNKKFLFMYSVSDDNRKDLRLLFDNMYLLFEDDSDYLCIKNLLKKKFVGFKYKNMKKFMNIYKSLEKFENIYEKILIITMIMQILEIEEKISELKLDEYKGFITFCDIFEQDNFMVQKFSNSKIITITMQHGQAYCKKNNEDNDDLEYENFTADFKLSWGQKTKDEMIKGGISKSRIVNVGNAKYFNKKRTKLYNEDNCVFGIVLNNKQTIDENKKMINHANYLCKNFNLKYCVKIHPADNIDNYKNEIIQENLIKVYKHEELEDYLQSVHFSIANYSSIYMELFYYYHPTMLYLNKFTENVYIDDFNTYRNLTELNKLYCEFIKNIYLYEEDIIKKSHYFISENGKKKFLDFIQSL